MDAAFHSLRALYLLFIHRHVDAFFGFRDRRPKKKGWTLALAIWASKAPVKEPYPVGITYSYGCSFTDEI